MTSTTATAKTSAGAIVESTVDAPLDPDVAVPAVSTVGTPTASATDLTVAVVGLGYVGLPTALALATSGAAVIGVDVSQGRIDSIRRGDVDLIEADRTRLERLAGRDDLELTTNPARLRAADAVIVCVPTPVDRSRAPDLGALTAACQTVVAHARPGQTIVLTSTTYVGSTRHLLVRPLTAAGLRPGHDIHVAFAPERIDPGNSLFPQEQTARVVGGVTRACTASATKVLSRINPTIHEVSSAEAAELTKLLENTFRAVNIALANEFADVARHLGVNVTEVITAAATKPYGFMPFYPGAGVGGHCIPCDPHYLTWQLRGDRVASPVIDVAMTAIAGRPRQVVARAREVLGDRGRPIGGARVLVLGVAYKPGVADMRESPALEIMSLLADAGATVAFTDPYVGSVAGFTACPDPTAHAWDLILVHTMHPGTDTTWLGEQTAVLDATYRLAELPLRETV